MTRSIRMVVSVAALGIMPLFAAETVVYDDFGGVKPDGGVNDFWDVRSHKSVNVNQSTVMSSSAIDANWFSIAYSNLGRFFTDAPGFLLFLK